MKKGLTTSSVHPLQRKIRAFILANKARSRDIIPARYFRKSREFRE